MFILHCLQHVLARHNLQDASNSQFKTPQGRQLEEETHGFMAREGEGPLILYHGGVKYDYILIPPSGRNVHQSFGKGSTNMPVPLRTVLPHCGYKFSTSCPMALILQICTLMYAPFVEYLTQYAATVSNHLELRLRQ